MLDGVIVAVVATLAGADVQQAGRLGLAMTTLQVSIGALNDLVDAPIDAGRKLGKPIPAGLVSTGLARAIVGGGAGIGLGLSVLSGTGTGVVALAGLALGYIYDLRLKGTAWSWIPLAIGIPLIPVFAWLGATGTLPDWFAVLLPLATVAGGALAIANAAADFERDTSAGIDSVAVRLGLERAWWLSAALLGSVCAVALVTLAFRHGGPGSPFVAIGMAAVAVIGLGVALSRGADARRRERGWEIEAIGVGLLAAAWVAGIMS